jgi:hypothetical protein
MPDQVPLVEVDHGIVAVGLDGLIECLDLGRQRLYRARQ